MSDSQELIVGGLKVAAVEQRYEAKYVGYYSIPGTGDGPFLVFYRETLNEREIANNFDNYFGLYRKPWNEDVIIFNAKKIRDAEFAAIEVAPGEFICSRSVHNMVSHPSGAWLDGGPFYTRCSPDHRPTHVMRIVDGNEVFTPNVRVLPSTLPPAAVEPAVPNVIDAEFTEVVTYQDNGVTALLADVRAFHIAVDQPVRTVPAFPVEAEVAMRRRLIAEEWEELQDALDAGDIVEVADACADIIYVVIGLAHHFGLPLDRVWQEVQSSNMAKVDPETGKVRKRADGKVLKPEGWLPPNIPRALGINVDITV